MAMDYRLSRSSSGNFPEIPEKSRKYGKTFGGPRRTLQCVETDYRQDRLTRAQRVTARWAA